ncbi:MAG TPA: isoamylase early set domain-containing protein [Gemmatimonadales bacterium]|nr:isoamylase early set domain-containing protein [Gemmatimonadales bacterium]
MVDVDDDRDSSPLLEALVRELRSARVPESRAVEAALAGLARDRRWRRWAIASAVVAAALVLGLSLRLPGRRETLPIRFELRAPGSRAVAVVGDFNDWNPAADPLTDLDGEWSVTLRLRPGRYRYAYLLDGRHWAPDAATPRADNDFNTPTSVITVAN